MRAYDEDRTILQCGDCARIDRFSRVPGPDRWHYVCACGWPATRAQNRMTSAIVTETIHPLVDETEWPPIEAA